MKRFVVAVAVSFSIAAAFGQSLYTNYSFETPGSVGWEQAPYYSNGACSQVMGASDAADGSAYARITITSGGSGYQVAWEPTTANYDLAPNARYTLTYKWRSSDPYITPNVGQPYAESAVYGNTGYESFYIGDNIAMPGNAANVWYTETVNITTPICDRMSRWTGVFFGAFAFFGPTGTLDFDDIRLQLITPIPTKVDHQITSATLGTYEYSNLKCRIKWNSVNQDSTSTVELMTGTPPGLGSRVTLGRWWVISPYPGTFSAQPIFSYTDAELTAAGLTWSQLKVLKQDGAGPWAEVSKTVDTTRKTVTVSTAQSSFSNWVLAGPAPAGVDDWKSFE